MTDKTISVETLQAMLAQKQPVTVLDIRQTNERAEWAIPGSIHVDAYQALKAGDPQALAGVDLPADQPVVTVCGVGVTSKLAAEQLQSQGFTAFSLAGGMKAWSLAWNSAEILVARDRVRLIQIRRTGKGCVSYLIGSHGAAVVIDPALEPAVYLNLAHQNGWTISHVLDTHIHADHLSRARVLAELTGAAFYLPDQKRASYPFQALRDGDQLEIGVARLDVLHTPGHTSESVCYRLNDQALLTGDTLFLTGVGRPDLEADPDEARQRAHRLYHSLQRLLTLPPETLILPGHTSEPVAFDGVAIAASLAEVRHQADLLSVAEDRFVERILARIPPTPPNHHRIVELNETGRQPETDPAELEAGANRCAVS